MKGLAEILGSWDEVAGRGESATLATVVKVSGSSFRRPGARMLFPASGPPVGFVSGGCLEADLAQRAAEVLGSGASRTIVYDMRSPDDIVWGLGLGCGGEIRVLLERILPDAPPRYLSFIGDRVRRRVPAVLATLFELDGDRSLSPDDRVMLAVDGASAGSMPHPELQSRVLDHGHQALRRASLGCATTSSRRAARPY
jgi:xanthine dehydrogenase accessory factor